MYKYYMDKRSKSHQFRMHTNTHTTPVRLTIAEKNNRNYKEAWSNVAFAHTGPMDCEYEHPLTGKCMSHYDYQVWMNRHRSR
jgi:hypothetical protein